MLRDLSRCLQVYLRRLMAVEVRLARSTAARDRTSIKIGFLCSLRAVLTIAL